MAQNALSATAFAAAGSGSKAANAISDDTSIDATGTATWASLVTSGAVRLHDFSCSTSGANYNVNTTSFSAGGTHSVTSYTITQAA